MMLFGRLAVAADMPERYQQWLKRDAAYIITDEEKEAFKNLSTDKERDNFIEHFWEIRNPTPGSPVNSYKEEHYRRIAYANQWFGPRGEEIGWRTPRGRIYITLGEPKQKAVYYSVSELRPMEIWFYSNAHPALPPFFYIIFYQRYPGDEWRIYSPYFEGPSALTTALNAENNRREAYLAVKEKLGSEVARTTLSLITSEPVDTETAQGSISSDVMLGTIQDLANNPFTKDMLNQRRAMLEGVSSRMILPGEFLDVVTVPLRDSLGNTALHYLLRLGRPDDFTLAEDKDGRYYYSAEVVARVLTPDGKVIFSQDRNLSEYLDKSDLTRIRNRVPAYRGVLPLAPGKYKVEFLFSDKLKRTAFRKEVDIEIPQPPDAGLAISPIMAFSQAHAADPVLADRMPFTVGNVEFEPLASQELVFVPGEDLNILYQVWAPPADPKSYGDQVLEVRYAYGRLGVSGDAKTIDEKVAKAQFSEQGFLVTGKKIPLADLQPGPYVLTVTVTDPVTRDRSYGRLSFKVDYNATRDATWFLSDPDAASVARSAAFDQQRALSLLAQDKEQDAVPWLRNALAKDSKNELVRAKLIGIYYAAGQYDKVAELLRVSGVSENTDEQTLLRMAESLDRLGDTQRAIQLLEAGLHAHSSSGPLYLALASYYQRIGNSSKASELEQKGRNLSAAQAPTS